LLCATVGATTIVIVVVSSVRWARRRMRYGSWHVLHLYAYAGMAFALLHQVLRGPDFHALAAQVYWWTVYGSAVAAIIIFRVLTPLSRSVYHRLRVVAVTPEGSGVMSVTMTGRHLQRLNAKAGQFHLAVPRRPGLDAGASVLVVRPAC